MARTAVILKSKSLVFTFVLIFIFTSNLALCFTDAWDFSDGLAPVQINGKWGYINVAGKLVIANTFERAGTFSEGLAFVYKNGQLGMH